MKSLLIADPKKFANWLVGIRGSRSISQAKLSQASHVSTRTIDALENVKFTKVRTDVLLRLAYVLNVLPKEIALKAGPEHEEAIDIWEKNGGKLGQMLQPNAIVCSPHEFNPAGLDQVLKKEDLKFLLEMCEKLKPFTLRFAINLLDLRKKQ